jgi:LPXTG-motif cell wall-anchored protein
MKTNKFLMWGGAALLTGAAAYFIVKKRKQKQSLQPGLPVNESTNGNFKPVASNPVKSDFPLQIGSRGENVKKLQTYLNQKVNAGLVVDGIFGAKTAEAVKKAIGTDKVSQEMFMKYIGIPSGQDGNKLMNFAQQALTAINPAFRIFK